MKMNPKETGKRIQLLRKQKDLSQEEDLVSVPMLWQRSYVACIGHQ